MVEDRIMLLREPNSAVAEAYRSLRAKLSRPLASGKRVFMVVSSWAGDGKSMVCTNLAVAVSQLQVKVLLVDGDLRRPTLSRVFGRTEIPGLSNLLEGNVTLEQCCYPTAVDNLFTMPKGTSEQNPANLLGGDNAAEVFAQLGRAFGCVIIDTSPLAACSDALLLGGKVDAALMVVNPKSWDGDVEPRLKDQLVEHGVEVLGFVLNGADSSSHGYGYGYGYGYGSGAAYGYGDEDKKPEKKRKGLLGWLKGRD